MPKTYQTPEEKQEQDKESKKQKVVGVYGAPEQTGTKKSLLIAVAIIIALLILFLVYRMARGGEVPGGNQQQLSEAAWSSPYFYSTDR